MSNQIARGTIVLTAGGDAAGILTGGHRPCALEGCTGLRLATRWPDGRLTFPCTNDMAFDPDQSEWRESAAAIAAPATSCRSHSTPERRKKSLAELRSRYVDIGGFRPIAHPDDVWRARR